jgi:hypothetical protein
MYTHDRCLLLTQSLMFCTCIACLHRSETVEACSFHDTIEDGFCLVICVMSREYVSGVILDCELFEKCLSYVSRTFFESSFGILGDFFHIDVCDFERESILRTILSYDRFIAISGHSKSMMDVCDDDVSGGFYAYHVEQTHRIHTTATSDDTGVSRQCVSRE